MQSTQQTIQQLDRFLRKIAEKFPSDSEPTLLTDVHIRVNQDTGELTAFDDDDHEITRCVVEQWIDSKDDNFFSSVASSLRRQISANRSLCEHLSILTPYAFVLEDEEREPQSELYVVDGDTVILSPELMSDLDEDLDLFFANLMKE